MIYCSHNIKGKTVLLNRFMENSKILLRLLGISGVLGGMLLFVGDMLFYYNGSSADLKLNMANSSDIRIEISGILALFSTWFYLLGALSVYYAFVPVVKWVRKVMMASFVGILVSYGIIHGAYVAIATTAKVALQNNLDIEMATTLASGTNALMRLFIYPIFVVFSIVFIWQVFNKKTLYPRWMLIFFPLTLFIFKGLLKNNLSGGIGVVINGGFFNLILVIFFLTSTIALWNNKINDYGDFKNSNVSV
jgi:hypothetical protein